MTTKQRAVLISVEVRFIEAFEWHAKLCLLNKPVLPVTQGQFREWYDADPENECMYDEIQAIFTRHARRQLATGPAPGSEDWLTIDEPELLEEFTQMILRRQRDG